MFDFFRNLRKSAAEKRQEQISAYLDGEMTPAERGRFESALEQEPALRADLEAFQQIKRSVQALPRIRAPRNYVLDPAVYGAQKPAPSFGYYPVLRTATALTALFLVLLVSLDLITPGGGIAQAGREGPLAAAVEEVMVAEDEVAQVEMAEDMADLAPAESAPVAEDAAEVEVFELEVEEEMAAEVAEEAVVEEEALEAPSAAELADEEAPAPPDQESIQTLETPDAEPDRPVSRLAVEEDVAGGIDEEAAVEELADTDIAGADVEDVDEVEPLPWLLIVELVLAAAVIVLLVLTLVTRRRLP
ncbi:MAG: zf-HC2 domain-containing protein [Candidatus Promineifilaceae bacterium]|nr:zf-HC2 domain-containing protein [Candidatus Promineifilaceae bacterium]